MKLFSVQPLAMTVVNWEPFIAAYESLFEERPTVGLDDQNIDVRAACAYLGVLSLDNNPTQNLTQGIHTNNTHDHMFCAFFTALTPKVQRELMDSINLHFLFKHSPDAIFAIMSGTMTEWYYAILKGCSKARSVDLRRVFNDCYNHLENAGLARMFESHTIVHLGDNTFYIRR